MKYIIISIMLLFFSSNASACKIISWTWYYQERLKSIQLEGETTCKRGIPYIRLYSNGKFIGVATSSIRGYALKGFRYNSDRPISLTIKYSIEIY